jgi:putative transposase
MAAHPKRARRRGAHLVLIDESGLLMLPLVRRSWALRGHPPALRYKSGHRQKLSIAAALWLTPNRDHLGLSYRTLKNDYFNNQRVADFLTKLQRQLGSMVVLWDGGTMHKGDPIRAVVNRSQGRMVLERLPAQGAELMPVEQLWTWLKYGQLSNYAPQDVNELETVARGKLEKAQANQQQLRGLFHASLLPLPRALLR